MIPKKIHYCWFGKKTLPKDVKKCILSWEKYCPDYEFIKWDEKNFSIRKAPLYVREAYKYKKWAFVSDYVRLWCIYKYGGIYLDTDVELINTLDNLLGYSAFFGFECLHPNGNYDIATGLGFGSIKGNPILLSLLSDYQNIPFIKSDGSMDQLGCPRRNRHVFAEYGFELNNKTQVINNIIVLSSDYLCPITFYDSSSNFTENTISIHHFAGSWMKEKRSIKRVIKKILKSLKKYMFRTTNSLF